MSEQDTLATRLKDAREESGLSVGEAAERMAVRPATLKSWESGKTVPRGSKLHLLAGILSVSVAWLLDGDENVAPVTERWSRLERLEQKVERMNLLQRELVELSAEITQELAQIRELDDALEELAA